MSKPIARAWPASARDARRADHAAGRAREQRVRPAKARRLGEAAGGLHEAQPRARQRRGELSRRGGAAAASGRRRRPRSRRARAGRARAPARAEPTTCAKPASRASAATRSSHAASRYAWMPTIATDSKPALARRRERRPRGRLVEGLERAAVRVGAPGQLERARVQRRRLLDREREQLGPLLRADLEQLAEAGRRDQQRAHAAPLEQRVGRDGRAELHGAGRERSARRERARLAQHRLARPPPAPRPWTAPCACGAGPPDPPR